MRLKVKHKNDAKEDNNKKNFKEKFIKGVPESFHFQKTPLQIYPLSMVKKHLIVPFPLIQLESQASKTPRNN